MEIIEVGFYDSDNTFYIMEDYRGFERNSTECARMPVSHYIVRLIDNLDNNNPSVKEVEITREQANFLSSLNSYL